MTPEEIIEMVRQADREAQAERSRESHRRRREEGKRAGQKPILSDEVRQRIYTEHQDGRSLREIGAGLEADGVETAKGGCRWYASTVKAVITSVELDRELSNAQ